MTDSIWPYWNAQNKMNKIMVTGASGFIASHCLINLLRHNYRVVGTIRNLKREKVIRSTISRSCLDNNQIEFKKAISFLDNT